MQAAAEVTFGVDAAELTPAQAASLAAAIKAPSAYSLQSAPESNRERREYILSIMLEENMLTQAEYDAAMVFVRPKNSAPSAIPHGFHWPKIITARARKPKTGHAVFQNFHSLTPAMIYTMPPRPPSTPEISTPA